MTPEPTTDNPPLVYCPDCGRWVETHETARCPFCYKVRCKTCILLCECGGGE